MKLALSVVFAALFAALASAQVGAPNPQGSNTLAESVQKSPDGRTVLSGNARMQITGTVEVSAEEITVSADGREMTLRGNVTMTIPATPRPLK
jgi:hypothetical protein